MSDAIVRLPGIRGFIANLFPGVLNPGEIGIVINEDARNIEVICKAYKDKQAFLEGKDL